jgi:hypothetical protein
LLEFRVYASASRVPKRAPRLAGSPVLPRRFARVRGVNHGLKDPQHISEVLRKFPRFPVGSQGSWWPGWEVVKVPGRCSR